MGRIFNSWINLPYHSKDITFYVKIYVLQPQGHQYNLSTAGLDGHIHHYLGISWDDHILLVVSCSSIFLEEDVLVIKFAKSKCDQTREGLFND